MSNRFAAFMILMVVICLSPFEAWPQSTADRQVYIPWKPGEQYEILSIAASVPGYLYTMGALPSTRVMGIRLYAVDRQSDSASLAAEFPLVDASGRRLGGANCHDIASDAQGMVYAIGASGNEDKLVKYSWDGKVVAEIPHISHDARALAVSGDGTAYVEVGGDVIIYSPDGQQIGLLPRLGEAFGMTATGPEGFYMSNGTAILHYTQEGQLLTRWQVPDAQGNPMFLKHLAAAKGGWVVVGLVTDLRKSEGWAIVLSPTGEVHGRLYPVNPYKRFFAVDQEGSVYSLDTPYHPGGVSVTWAARP